MRRPRTPFPTESPMLLEIDPTLLPEMLTAFGCVPLVVPTFRSLGMPVAVLRSGGWLGGLFDHGAGAVGRRQDGITLVDVIGMGVQGKKCWCQVAARQTVHAASALGWQARRATASRTGYTWGYGVADLWSNQHRKWFVLDTDFNVVYDVDDVPQSAFAFSRRGLDLPRAGRLRIRAIAAPNPSMPAAGLLPFYAYVQVDLRSDWNARFLAHPDTPSLATSSPTQRLLGPNSGVHDRVRDNVRVESFALEVKYCQALLCQGAGMLEKAIRVGLTEEHGMTAEAAAFPADGIEYRFLKATRVGSPFFTSPIKGFMSRFDTSSCDVVESVISPVYTNKPWVYSLAVVGEALAFSLANVPLPSSVRCAYLRYLFSRRNFRRFLFWSQAGMASLDAYPILSVPSIRNKAEVVYPAVRKVDDGQIRFNDGPVKLLFSGDFFRKGGVNVVDAFEKLSQAHPDVTLTVCSDEHMDFNTADTRLRDEFLAKIRSHPRIVFGRIPRAQMIDTVLPGTDVYLLPTYQEAFGFAILEAMAFGIPVIATNIMAIPELVEDGESGLLIDTTRFDCDEMFKGYVINHISDAFRRTVTEELYRLLVRLVESPSLRRTMGLRGLERARTLFSFEERNRTMKRIYEEAHAARAPR